MLLLIITFAKRTSWCTFTSSPISRLVCPQPWRVKPKSVGGLSKEQLNSAVGAAASPDSAVGTARVGAHRTPGKITVHLARRGAILPTKHAWHRIAPVHIARAVRCERHGGPNTRPTTMHGGGTLPGAGVMSCQHILPSINNHQSTPPARSVTGTRGNEALRPFRGPSKVHASGMRHLPLQVSPAPALSSACPGMDVPQSSMHQ